MGNTRRKISASTQGLQQDESHLGGKMTKSAIAVPSLALGQVSTVKILEMYFHDTFTGFLVFSSEVELPWVTVVKAHTVHNTEIGKIVLRRSSE